jgi:hypothetical protein
MKYLASGPVYGAFEKQSIPVDGNNSEFSLNYQVGSAGSLLVIKNGGVLESNVDYAVSNGGITIIFNNVPLITDNIYVTYLGRELSIPRTVGLEPKYETFVGDGIQDSFLLTSGPVNQDSVIVYVDKVLQRPSVDFIIIGNLLNFSIAPVNGHFIDIYVHGVERLDNFVIANGSITGPKIANETITANKLNFMWTNYVPNIQTFGGMTFSNLNLISTKFMDLGKLIKIQLHFQLTLAGTPDNKIRIELPQTNNGDLNTASDIHLTTASTIENGICVWGGVNHYDIHRQNGVNYFPAIWDVKIKTEFDPAV